MKSIFLFFILIISFSILHASLSESENFIFQRAGELQGYCNSHYNSFSSNYILQISLGYDIASECLSSYQFALASGFYDFNILTVKTEEYTIEQSNEKVNNHPNPFNPSTTIEFSIEQNAEAEIEIFNIKGQKVKSFLINSSTDQPINSVVWNGDDENNKPAASGIYYYKLNINGKTEAAKKCLLLK